MKNDLKQKYGPDFFKKLAHYKTAKYQDKWITILDVDLNAESILVRVVGTSVRMIVKIEELDEFCL